MSDPRPVPGEDSAGGVVTPPAAGAADEQPAPVPGAAQAAQPAPVEPVTPAADSAADLAGIWEPDPAPLGVEVPAPTGEAAVDAALARLAVLDGVPTTGHADVYENVHQSLTSVLASLDEPDPPRPGLQPPRPPGPRPSHAPHAPRATH
jgi:hypothetical protein